MNAQTRPERLFRFFPPAASDFFSAKKLWFSAVKDYNDPFDALPRFDTMLESAKKHAIKVEHAFLPSQVKCDWPTFNKVMNRESSDFCTEGIDAVTEKYRDLVSERLRLVCFFSGKMDELLMWSHYASSHTGFMVEFDQKHSLFATDEFAKVQYESERPEVEGKNDEELWKILFTKSRREWIDEDEWRFVKSANSLADGKRRDGKKMRYLELPPDSVRRVYFGCRILLGNCVEILESLQKTEWQRVEKFVMCPHEAKYAIEAIPWKQWWDKPTTFRKELEGVLKRSKPSI